MQLVRTAQSKHKINLLALSTEDGGPYVVATWYVVLIVCSINSTAQFKHKHLLALSTEDGGGAGPHVRSLYNILLLPYIPVVHVTCRNTFP